VADRVECGIGEDDLAAAARLEPPAAFWRLESITMVTKWVRSRNEITTPRRKKGKEKKEKNKEKRHKHAVIQDKLSW